MSKPIMQLLLQSNGDFTLQPAMSRKDMLATDRARDALRHAIDFNAAIRGLRFTVDNEIDNSGEILFKSLKDGGEQKKVIDAPESFGSGEGMDKIVYEKVPAREESDDIDSGVLESIRSFAPEEEDKVFAYIDYDTSRSGVLSHRQRAMYLLRRGYSVLQIKELVENKTKKLTGDTKVKSAILGIPKKKMELFLSDSVLIHRDTTYSPLLRALFEHSCIVSEGMIDLVPDYIGRGGKGEDPISEEETYTRRRRFLSTTASYLQPLYTSQSFRTMIHDQKAKLSGHPG